MRRSFIRVYVELVGLLGLAAIATAVVQGARTDDWLWLGAGASWLALFSYLAWSKLGNPVRSRTDQLAMHGIGFAGAIVATLASPWALALGLLGEAASIGYTHWYSRQHRPIAVVTVGEKLPLFPLVTLDGSVTSSTVLTDGPRVILFYRGNWCPFCVAQITAVAQQYRELDARGVKVSLISPQRADETEELSRRFDVPMEFFVDADGAAAQVLDIVQSGGTPVSFGAGTNGDTVVPTVIITREDGTVAWVHHAENHRVRPEPTTYLEVLDREGIGVARRGA